MIFSRMWHVEASATFTLPLKKWQVLIMQSRVPEMLKHEQLRLDKSAALKAGERRGGKEWEKMKAKRD